MFCTKCGANNTEGAKFCTKCGEPFKEPILEKMDFNQGAVPAQTLNTGYGENAYEEAPPYYTGSEIKSRAKEAFKAQYWMLVGILILTSLIMGAGSTTVVGVFFLVPFSSVSAYAFLNSYLGRVVDFDDAFRVGLKNFLRKVGSLALVYLYTCLWSLLFVIPGIIKSFSYSMTIYILTEYKDVNAADAIKLSQRMMKGHKFEYFVFCLSFIGWILLSAITFGIVGLFYTNPYMATGSAGFYLNVKNAAIKNNIISKEELGVSYFTN